MDQRVLHEKIRGEAILNNVTVKRSSEREGGEAGAGFGEEREAKVVRGDAGKKHLIVEGEGVGGVLGGGEGSDDGAVEEGAGIGDGGEELEGVVCGLGTGGGGEKEELGDDVVVGGVAGNCSLGVDLVELFHGLALAQKACETISAALIAWCQCFHIRAVTQVCQERT